MKLYDTLGNKLTAFISKKLHNHNDEIYKQFKKAKEVMVVNVKREIKLKEKLLKEHRDYLTKLKTMKAKDIPIVPNPFD